MPIATDPQQTFNIVLEFDEDKPAETRPTFICRYLTARQWKQIARLQDEIDEASRGDVALDKILDALTMSVAGWRNMTDTDGREIPFDLSGLDALLTMGEVMELFQKILTGQKPTETDEKKSVSQSHISSDESAKPADLPAGQASPASV